MARLPRITHKIFASTAANNGVFGSAQDGTKVLSNDLPTLMGKPAWLTGWMDAIMGASKFPPLEEMQSSMFVHSQQIGYLLQQGLAEYISTTEYFIGNMCMEAGTFKLYGSLVNANLGNALSDPTKWQLLSDFSVAPITTFGPGDAKISFNPTAAVGWVVLNDGSIGNAASGATLRANADTLALYTVIYNATINTWAPVSGGRGANAAADFAANKTLTIPKVLGRALAVAGAGSGLTARVLGQVLGEEAHPPTLAEMFAHTHTANVTDPGHYHIASPFKETAGNSGTSIANYNADTNVLGIPNPLTSTDTTGITVSNTSAGSSTAFNVMQPTTFFWIHVKL